jgi:hypothetical protein
VELSCYGLPTACAKIIMLSALSGRRRYNDFYFTIAFAFHQYHLISQSAAFGVMVIITVLPF